MSSAENVGETAGWIVEFTLLEGHRNESGIHAGGYTIAASKELGEDSHLVFVQNPTGMEIDEAEDTRSGWTHSACRGRKRFFSG